LSCLAHIQLEIPTSVTNSVSVEAQVSRERKDTMSISSMVDAKLVRESDTAKAREPNALEKKLGLASVVGQQPSAEGKGPQPVGVPSSVADQLVRWIPTETLTLYVAYIAVAKLPTAPKGMKLYQADFFWQWVGVFGGAAITIAFVVLLALGKARAAKEPYRWPIFEMAAAAVAFVAWAFALPDTPLLTFDGYKTEVGALLVTGVTVIIAVVAYACGKQPPDPLPDSAAGERLSRSS
jgi:hypothetical protein